MTESIPSHATPSLPRDERGLATTTDALLELEEHVPRVLRSHLEAADYDRIVLTLDGTAKTALAATLATEAVGSASVTGLVMPAFISQEATARDAEAIATGLDIEHERVQLYPALAAFQEAVEDSSGRAGDLVATERTLARLRMAATYHVAETTNAVVIGGTTRTEILLGSATKYGDTGVDCLPFGGLYRTEVCALADHVGIPDALTSGPDTSASQARSPTAIDGGLSDRTVDEILRLSVDHGLDRATVANRTGVDNAHVERLTDWVKRTAHNRQYPPSAPL